MVAVYEHPVTVVAPDIDDYQHVNNLAYLRWMLAAAGAHTTVQGWPAKRYRKEGCGWVVRAHKVEYLKPARLDDSLVVRTWVATLKKASSVRRYEVVRADDGTLLVRGETEWAFVDFATLRPKRIPPEVIASFEIHEG